MSQLILASTSVYRRELLERLRLAFESHAPEVDEEAIKDSGLSPLEISRQLSQDKALALKGKFPDAVIIGSDQVLDFEGESFGKPIEFDAAFEQLKKLSGNTHFLHTSYALSCPQGLHVETVTAKMQMRQLSDQAIKNYIQKDEPFYCCGSYKLESLGISLFERIDCEDHTAIIGLPMMKLTTQLLKRGFSLP